MPQTKSDLDLALRGYWALKEKQLAAAEAIQSTAEGSAKAVRGGGHFEPVVQLIASFFTDAGYPADSIFAKGHATILPAYLRPTKNWDLVVVHRGILVAAIELKALGGPSFGNNYSNRLEEAIGCSVDITAENAANLLGPEKPWLGYFFVIQDHPLSQHIVRERSSKSFPRRLLLGFIARESNASRARGGARLEPFRGGNSGANSLPQVPRLSVESWLVNKPTHSLAD